MTKTALKGGDALDCIEAKVIAEFVF